MSLNYWKYWKYWDFQYFNELLKILKILIFSICHWTIENIENIEIFNISLNYWKYWEYWENFNTSMNYWKYWKYWKSSISKEVPHSPHLHKEIINSKREWKEYDDWIGWQVRLSILSSILSILWIFSWIHWIIENTQYCDFFSIIQWNIEIFNTFINSVKYWTS